MIRKILARPATILGLVAILALAGCQSDYVNIMPNERGLIMTPTGPDGGIRNPGQVNLGQVNVTTDLGNVLYVFETGAYTHKEQFLGPDGREDGADGRCTLADGIEPMTLDVRLTFAMPDLSNQENAIAAISRLLELTPATPDETRARTFRIDLENVYLQQVQPIVRDEIRAVCATFETFAAAAIARNDGSFEDAVSERVRAAMEDLNVPMILLFARPSNMKPDQSVVDAASAEAAAESRAQAAIDIASDINASDDPGLAWEVFRLQVMREIATLPGQTMFLDLNSGGGDLLPVPVQSGVDGDDTADPIETEEDAPVEDDG